MLPAFYEQGYDPIKIQFPHNWCRTFKVRNGRSIDGVVLFGFTGITEEMLARSVIAGSAGA